MSLRERLWSRVVRRESGCWEWTGWCDPYGVITAGARGAGVLAAHRLAWILTNGPIPDGLGVLHRCDNPPCCAPSHLFLGTPADNNADRDAKGRGDFRRTKTHCPADHPYAGENLYVFPDGRRACRICRRVSQRAYYNRERERGIK